MKERVYEIEHENVSGGHLVAKLMKALCGPSKSMRFPSRLTTGGVLVLSRSTVIHRGGERERKSVD